MCLRLFAGVVTAITLLIPAYGMAAGTDIHELLNSRPAAVTSDAAPIHPFWDAVHTDTMTLRRERAVVQAISENGLPRPCLWLTRRCLSIRAARAGLQRRAPKSLPCRIPKRLVQQRASESDRARPSSRP